MFNRGYRVLSMRDISLKLYTEILDDQIQIVRGEDVPLLPGKRTVVGHLRYHALREGRTEGSLLLSLNDTDPSNTDIEVKYEAL